MPSATRLPFPRMVAAAVAMRLLNGPIPSMVLAWLLMIDTYLHPMIGVIVLDFGGRQIIVTLYM